MVLGVDISTSITGFAIVTDNVLVYYDSIDLRKHKGVFAKTVAMKEKLMASSPGSSSNSLRWNHSLSEPPPHASAPALESPAAKKQNKLF